MSVERYRSIADMPRPWRDRDDPRNLKTVAEMMDFYYRFCSPTENRVPAVHRFQTPADLDNYKADHYRKNPR